MSNNLREIVVVGGGTAGWMTAAALSRFVLNSGTRVILVESDEIGIVGVGEATIPTIGFYLNMLGIEEDEFLRRTGGTFKLGIEFEDWGRIGDRYLHPFDNFGRNFEGLWFHQVWAKMRGLGPVPPLADFSLGTVAAREHRFARDVGDPPCARQRYAFHIDAGLLARFLRDYAEARGVARVEGRIASVERDAENGHVRALVLADGRRVEGEFFVDCSGFRALLIGGALGVPFESWAGWLPCNRAIAVPTAGDGLAPYTRATARTAGWQWRIPLQHRTGNGHVYCDAFIGREAAEAQLLANLPDAPVGQPRHLSFEAGVRARAWEGNVVAIGLAAGFLEPLESTSIHLIQTGISKLLALLPDRRFAPVARTEYNRLMARSYGGVRDFIILHYAASQRRDTPFWRHVGAMGIPDSLAHRIALFREKGRFFRYDDELFDVASWVAVLYGQNIVPDGYDPVVDALDEGRVARAMAGMHAAIRRAVDAMPAHADFVAAHCRMPDPSAVSAAASARS